MDVPETDSEDEMAPGWEERCTADGFVFYAHHATQTTQWYHPRTNKRKKVTGELPFGWERQITEDGKVFFVDHINHKTTYTDPRLAFAVEESRSLGDLRQRFDSSTTGIQVLHGRDLTGKVAVVTGGSSGIGYETVRSLAYHGCTVVMTCRELAEGEEAAARIYKQRPSASLNPMTLDLTSLANVKTFAQAFAVRFGRCDILVLNAGVFGLGHTHTPDGFETMFQVNHLSHFYLTLLLQPLLAKCAPARVIYVSCEAHRFSKLEVDSMREDVLSPSLRSPFVSLTAYCNTKLCNVLSALEMQRRFGEQGINFYAVHPGNAVPSGLARHWWPYRLLFTLVRPFTKTLQQACASSVFCAASTDIARYGGVYINNCVPCMPSAPAMDPILAHRLHNVSLAMIETVLGKRAFNSQSLGGGGDVSLSSPSSLQSMSPSSSPQKKKQNGDDDGGGGGL
ncbi:WW domain-containing oxidoreductase-like isoform X1 [Eriocheir sinensis]|uniref:WW domain-containing oxidoreductase-like isoform X1 n=1 Tax=Eriocheir sinensis TaxID=95602 RepID=UPI0021C5F726|nr:WW domain-containing oxidoreductase-like isoform X1 [Eriocheir sinensis]